jgi:hypothetical protein
LQENSIIDYSLLIGEIEEPIEEVKEKIRQSKDPEIAQGLYFSNKKAYIMGIIDPLTGYTCRKKAEYLFKSCRHGNNMSCVPPE